MGPKVVAIVGARLNSSRLPRKQLLPLAGKPLISHVFARLLEAPLIDEAVLATTADFYNKDLSDWAKSNSISCFEYEGDVDDLMGRVDTVVRAKNADIIVYVCGDSPLIEPTTINCLVATLIAEPQADWARMKELCDGENYIHEGFAVYRRHFWDRMVEASVEPFEREHVGAVYHALHKVVPDHTAYAEENSIFQSIDHRISVDTSSDYEFMQRVYSDWNELYTGSKIVDLKWVIDRLHNEPELRAINSHVRQKKVDETSLRVRVITQIGSEAGLGHLRRMVVAAQQVQDHLSASVCIDIWGEERSFEWLQNVPHNWRQCSIGSVLESCSCGELVIVDLPEFSTNLRKSIDDARLRGVTITAIDYVPEEDFFDAYYVPCFYVPANVVDRLGDKLFYGWECYLLSRTNPVATINDQPKNVVVMSGGSDFYKVGEVWPVLLDKTLPEGVEISWIQGPFAAPPNLAGVSETRRVKIVHNPPDLVDLIKTHDMALNVYGVTLFECLKVGVPTVTYVPEGAVKDVEIDALAAEKACLFGRDKREAVDLLLELCNQPKQRKNYSSKSSGLFLKNGVTPPLVTMIKQLTRREC